MSWDLIRSFLSVAETGSLSAASRDLSLTQPTVGRHIDLLETALGMVLFLRSREGMELTGHGADLLASATEMRAASVELERRAAGFDEALTGVVRVSANEIFGALVLPRVLTGFMNEHPEIEIEIDVSNSAANLLKRDADIALRMFRPVQNDLVARKVTEIPLGLYAHRDYLAAHPPPKSLEDLRQHRFIGFDRDTSLIEAARAMGVSFIPSDFAIRSDSMLAQIEAIRAGVGIGVTHQGLAETMSDVEQILPDLPLPALDLWIACHSDVRYNKRIRLLMDHLANRLRTPYS